jgi:hypothetical protein
MGKHRRTKYRIPLVGFWAGVKALRVTMGAAVTILIRAGKFVCW